MKYSIMIDNWCYCITDELYEVRYYKRMLHNQGHTRVRIIDNETHQEVE